MAFIGRHFKQRLRPSPFESKLRPSGPIRVPSGWLGGRHVGVRGRWAHESLNDSEILRT